MRSFLLLIIAICSVEAMSTGSLPLHYDSISSYSSVGPATVPVLTVIRSAEELEIYCLKTNRDTSIFLKMPDFSKEMVVGLLTVLGGGNRVKYRKLKRVISGNDSVFLEVEPDSKVYNTGVSIQAAAHVLLIVFEKTGKEIVMNEIIPISVNKNRNDRHAFYRIINRPDNLFDVQGRQLLQSGDYCGSAVIVKFGMKKVIPGACRGAYK